MRSRFAVAWGEFEYLDPVQRVAEYEVAGNDPAPRRDTDPVLVVLADQVASRFVVEGRSAVEVDAVAPIAGDDVARSGYGAADDVV